MEAHQLVLLFPLSQVGRPGHQSCLQSSHLHFAFSTMTPTSTPWGEGEEAKCDDKNITFFHLKTCTIHALCLCTVYYLRFSRQNLKQDLLILSHAQLFYLFFVDMLHVCNVCIYICINIYINTFSFFGDNSCRGLPSLKYSHSFIEARYTVGLKCFFVKSEGHPYKQYQAIIRCTDSSPPKKSDLCKMSCFDNIDLRVVCHL